MKYTTTRKGYLNSSSKPAAMKMASNPMPTSQANLATSDVILDQLNSRKLNTQQQAINSAAIQDHIMKQFNIKGLDPFKKQKTTNHPPRQTNFSTNGRQILQTNSISQQSHQRINSQQPQMRQQQQPDAITKILEDQTNKDENAYLDIEKKRIDYIKKLSLAQRLGLVEKPALPLSQNQWKQIEQQSLKRVNDKEPCPICYEDLRFQEQSILSCSHVFHKKCLESFEKFMKNKGQERACPICRKKDYDQKTYVEGQKRYLLRCIVVIQALVKGFLARNHHYENMKKSSYQPRNASLRKKFIGYKLSRIGKKYIDQMTKERQQVMDMIKKVDQNIVDTEKLLESFIPNMNKILQQRRERELGSRENKSKEEVKLNKFWSEVKEKALCRGDKDCPICYNPYKNQREVYLLNCSHVYHKQCLESFENFDFAQKKCCPMCRHPDYEKIIINP